MVIFNFATFMLIFYLSGVFFIDDKIIINKNSIKNKYSEILYNNSKKNYDVQVLYYNNYFDKYFGEIYIDNIIKRYIYEENIDNYNKRKGELKNIKWFNKIVITKNFKNMELRESIYIDNLKIKEYIFSKKIVHEEE